MLAETVIKRRRKLVVVCACLAVTGATQYCVPCWVPATLSYWPCHSAPSVYHVNFIKSLSFFFLSFFYVTGPYFRTATKKITESFNEAVAWSVYQPVFILGDFNYCDLSPHLPTVQRAITCATQLNRAIELWHGNTESAYRPECRPPLGRSSDQRCSLAAKVQTENKDQRNSNKLLSVMDSWQRTGIRGCFEATNWDVFTDNCTDSDELVNTVTLCVHFCEKTVIKTKSMHV